MNKRIPCTLLLAAFLSIGGMLLDQPHAAEDSVKTAQATPGASARLSGTPLATKEVDAFLDDLFARQKKLQRVQAEVVARKTGGAFKMERVSYGLLRAEMPNRLSFLDRGSSQAPLPPEECRLILVDGTYFWELDEGEEDEPRTGERRKLKQAAQEGRSADLVSFFVGKEVASTKELRQHFTITGARSKNKPADLYHFILTPADKEPKIVEIWIVAGALLPQKVKITTHKAGGSVGQKGSASSESVKVQELHAVKTNLDGLPPFAPEVFLPPLDQELAIADERGETIPPEQLKKDIAAVRAKLQKKTAPAPAPELDMSGK